MKAGYLTATSLDTLTSVYLTNACRCLSFQNEAPKARHSKACSPHLAHDILCLLNTHDSLYILCLGAVAATSLYRLCSVPNISLTKSFSQQGTPLTLPSHPDLSFPVYSTYHPAACLREPKLLYAVQDHLLLLRNSIRGSVPTPSTPSIIPWSHRWPPHNSNDSS